jgi:head-tail adaptor
MAIADYYTQTVNIITKTASTDPFDTSTATLAVTDTFDAAVNLLSGRERYIADQAEVLADYKVYCDASVSINTETKLRWNGNDYEVVEEPKNTLQRSHHQRVLMRKVDD